MSYRPPRYPADTSISVSVNGRDSAARVTNVATTGLRLDGVSATEVGHQVRIACGARLLTGQIVWLEGSVAGVELDQILSTQDVAWLRGTPVPQNQAGGKSHQRYNAGRFREL